MRLCLRNVRNYLLYGGVPKNSRPGGRDTSITARFLGSSESMDASGYWPYPSDQPRSTQFDILTVGESVCGDKEVTKLKCVGHV